MQITSLHFFDYAMFSARSNISPGCFLSSFRFKPKLNSCCESGEKLILGTYCFMNCFTVKITSSILPEETLITFSANA